MINTDPQVLNNFLVEVFHQILHQEEDALNAYDGGKLSVKEFHLIETVYRGMREGENTMGNIARMLDITVGSLTVSVGTLEIKGYLTRLKSPEDKRLVRIFPTHKAQEANMFHDEFHQRMMSSIAQTLNEEEMASLAKALVAVKDHFTKESQNSKKKE